MTGEVRPTLSMEQRYTQHVHAMEVITDLAMELEREGIEPLTLSEALSEVAINIRNNR